MSAHDISVALQERIKTELSADNVGVKYFNDIYGNVHTKSFLVTDVPSYPLVSVTPGPAQYRYEPSGIRWTDQQFHIRAYVLDEYDAERLIELLLTDLKVALDTPERIKYNVTKPDGSTIEQFVTIDNLLEHSTDEGVLRPHGVCELVIQISYIELIK